MVDSTLMVAKVAVHDDVHISQEPQDTVRLKGARSLGLRFGYSIHDQAKPQELWTFRITATVDGQDESMDETIIKDRKGASDDLVSNVGVDLTFPGPGSYEVAYELLAERSVREWDGDEAFKAVASETAQGIVTVHVE